MPKGTPPTSLLSLFLKSISTFSDDDNPQEDEIDSVMKKRMDETNKVLTRIVQLVETHRSHSDNILNALHEESKGNIQFNTFL